MLFVEVNSNTVRMRLSASALDSLCQNPFKYPRPKSMPHEEIRDGRRVPGTPTSYAFAYLHSKIMEHALPTFAREINSLLNSGVSEDEECGEMCVSDSFVVYPWKFESRVFLYPEGRTLKDMRDRLYSETGWKGLTLLLVDAAEFER